MKRNISAENNTVENSSSFSSNESNSGAEFVSDSTGKMPTITQATTTFTPRRPKLLLKANRVQPRSAPQPVTSPELNSFVSSPPPTAKSLEPSRPNLVTDDLEDVTNRKKRPGYWWILLLALLALLVIAVIPPLIVMANRTTAGTTSLAPGSELSTTGTPSSTIITASNLTSATTVAPSTTTTVVGTSASVTTATSISTRGTSTTFGSISTTMTPTSTMSTTSETTTETSTTTSTTIVCVSPYALTPNNTCVNLLIDFDNCGAVGNACPSNYTSCSGGSCSSAPAVQLANSNFIWTAAVNGSVDDAYFGTSLPFNITLYSTTTDLISVTSNGALCLGACSTAYTETALPSSSFGGATVFGFWDDLYIYAGTSQGIYQGTQGNAPNRTVIFEYYTSHFGQPSQYYHFQILFFEDQPGVVQMIYFDASDGGISCTIGVQGSSSGPSIMYTYDTAGAVTQNMTLTFDTNAGTYTSATIG